MNNRANSSTFERPFIPLSEFAGAYLDSHPNKTPDINAVLPALEAMGHSRELIEACFEAERVRREEQKETVDEVRRRVGAYEQAGEQAAGQPELEETIEGLETTLERSAQEVRWNTRGGCVECRMVGGVEWIECDGAALDDLMTRCSQVARLRVGRGTIPWKIRSRKDEARILGFVARKRPEAGKANRVHEDVLEWALQIKEGAYLLTEVKEGAYLLTEVEEKGGGLHRNERGARAPRWVERSAEAALIEAKWQYKCVRLPWGPRKRWVPPGGPGKLRATSAGPRKRRATSAGPRRVKLAPSTYAKG